MKAVKTLIPRKAMTTGIQLAGGIIIATALALTWARPATGADKPARIEITAGGKSAYAIVVPDQADQDRIMKAANLLQKTIKESSGAQLPIIKESELPKGTPAIYLGKSSAAKAAGLAIDKVQGWAYLNKTVGKDIFLVGDDGIYDIKEEKAVFEHLGTLKAVTAFLEDQVGVRFLLPGEYGIRVPKKDPLAVEAGMDKSWEPRFDYVIGRAPRDRVFAVALNLFGSTPILKTYGGHSYYSAVPEKEYAETHPEYFALVGGKRTPTGNHLCISNPEVQELMLKEMEKQLDKGYQWVELAQTDGYQPCNCDKCAALHPDIGERIWIVHRKLAEEMKKRRPGKKIMLLSYANTVPPPKSFTNFPDNVVVQMCNYTLPLFEAWAPFNLDKTVYIYNWGTYKVPGYGPVRTPQYAVDQIRLFHKNRVRGIYICGGYKEGIGYGLEGPVFYAYGKALGNPELDPRQLLEEYVNAVFGEAAVPMRAFYRAMFDRLAAYSVFDCPPNVSGKIPSSFSTPEDYYCHCFSAKLLGDMTINLKRATALAKDERVKEALKMVALEFNYVKNLASIYQVYRAYRVNPTQVMLDVLAGQVNERKQLIDSLFDAEGKPKQTLKGGLTSAFISEKKKNLEMGGRTGIGDRPPLNWDFAFMKEKGVLPGKGEIKRLEVRKVNAFKIDGNPDKEVWKDIPFQELSEISMGKTLNPARFKVAYDDQAFYVAVECEYSQTKWLDVFKPRGRDGNAWAQECIEILIDPYGEREKHCQLVFNPVADSTCDARYNYIDDPVHPLYGKRDASWNGEWEYAARIDKEKKRWTAEARFPFKIFDVDPASPGTMWTMNVARAEWPEEREKGGQAIYSTWSPNLEGRDFHDLASYGEVIFK